MSPADRVPVWMPLVLAGLILATLATCGVGVALMLGVFDAPATSRYDDFADPASGWPAQTSGAMAWRYRAGEYQAEALALGQFSGSYLAGRYTNAEVAITARVNPADAGGYGLICRWRDNRNFYFAGVRQGVAFISTLRAGRETVLATAPLQPIPQPVRLRLRCAEADLTLWVHDQAPLNAQDFGLGQGQVGLWAWANALPALIAFDDFSAAVLP